MTEPNPRQFAVAFLDNDWDGLRDQLAGDVRLRALLPKRVAEAVGSDAAIELMAGWFEPGERVIRVDAIDTQELGVKERISYRFETHVPAGDKSYQVEQHVLLRRDQSGRIDKVDLLCSGWVEVDRPTR